MIIPDPKANYKDEVRLFTTGEPFGVVTGLEYSCYFGTFDWSYTVRCKSKTNTIYTRVVTGDQLKVVKASNWPFKQNEATS